MNTTWVEAESDDYKTVEAEAVGFYLVEVEVNFLKLEVEAAPNSPLPDTLLFSQIRKALSFFGQVELANCLLPDYLSYSYIHAILQYSDIAES